MREPVAFESLELCAASMLVFHEALGLEVACKGTGGPLSFVSPMDSPERALASFVRLLESVGAIVYVEQSTVIVEGVAGEGVGADTQTGIVQGVDFSGVDRLLRGDALDLTAVHLPGVDPDAVVALGFSSLRVLAAADGAVVFGRSQLVEVVAQIAAPLETDVLSVALDAPGVEFPVPEGVQQAHDEETGRLSLIGPRAAIVQVARILEPYLSTRGNVAVDLHLVVNAHDALGGVTMSPRSASVAASSGRSATVAVPGGVVASGGTLTLTTGQSVPFETGRDDEGRVSYDYRDTGLVVTITPTRRADGVIRAVVSVELSDASADAQPRFTQTLARSSVNVTSGQSVLVASLDLEVQELAGALGALPFALQGVAGTQSVTVELYLTLEALGVSGARLYRGGRA